MGIIGWLIIGAIAGWIASMITGNNKKMGAGANIIVGIIGWGHWRSGHEPLRGLRCYRL